MANDRAKRDVNRVTSILGVTDDSNKELVQLRVDPVTNRLKVDVDSIDVNDGNVIGVKASDSPSIDAFGRWRELV